MQISRYHSDLAAEWNAFIAKSKNGTFLFDRNYMDYHADRFADHSLVFTNDKGIWQAVMPANERDGVLYSHQGLTYGGLIMSPAIMMQDVMECFSLLRDYMKEAGFRTLYYKMMPSCYHLCPAEEDAYALWRFGATLESRLVSTTIPLTASPANPPVERRRKRCIRKAEELSYTLREASVADEFWPVITRNLMERYNLRPVHSLEEMNLLMSRFPDNIKCYLAECEGVVEAGAVMYITPQTVHVQYAHATPKGKEDGAIDFLYSRLLKQYESQGFRFFDIGNSNEDGGHYLNENLIAQKQGFGGRAVCYDIYVFSS